MSTKYVGRFLLMFAAVLAATRAWADEAPPIVPQGDNTYSVTVKATHKFTRNTGKLKERAMEAARQFCTREGKQLKVVSVKEAKAMYLVGEMAQATLTFKALAANDPELAAPAVAAAEPPRPPPPINADILTSELTKLDDLRKKGLLTDDEFNAAKRKLLDRL